MDKFLIKKENDYIVYGSMYNLETDDLDVKNVLIACHGFGSDRNGETIRAIAKGLRNVVIVSFDWPGHGDSDEKLLIKNCMDNYEQAYDYVIRRFPKARLYLFGSSFGAYMTLQFLKKHPDYDVEKLFFKSPAIRMEKIFELLASGEDMTKYENEPYVTSSGVEVYYELYKEMLDIVITPENIINKPEIFIYHGTEDNLSLLEDVLMYQKENIHIEVLEGAEHSYRGEYFDRLINRMKEEIEI